MGRGRPTEAATVTRQHRQHIMLRLALAAALLLLLLPAPAGTATPANGTGSSCTAASTVSVGAFFSSPLDDGTGKNGGRHPYGLTPVHTDASGPAPGEHWNCSLDPAARNA